MFQGQILRATFLAGDRVKLKPVHRVSLSFAERLSNHDEMRPAISFFFRESIQLLSRGMLENRVLPIAVAKFCFGKDR